MKTPVWIPIFAGVLLFAFAALAQDAKKEDIPDPECDGGTYQLVKCLSDATKAEMKKVLADIQSGKFTRNWMLENKVNQTSFKATRAKLAEHPIEQVGEKLRAMMPWIKKGALVDKARN